MITDEALIALTVIESDRRDRELQARLSAWEHGWLAAGLELDGAYEAGFTDALMALKRAQHQAVRLTRGEQERWALRGQPRTRDTFAQPHPDDYTGGPVTW